MRLALQYCDQFVDIDQADITPTSFHRTDVRSIQVAQLRQFFLAESLLCSDSLDLCSKEIEQLAVLHGWSLSHEERPIILPCRL